MPYQRSETSLINLIPYDMYSNLALSFSLCLGSQPCFHGLHRAHPEDFLSLYFASVLYFSSVSSFLMLKIKSRQSRSPGEMKNFLIGKIANEGEYLFLRICQYLQAIPPRMILPLWVKVFYTVERFKKF